MAYPIFLALGGALALFLLVVVSDYIDGWRRRRALGHIPIVDEGSNLSPALRWRSCPFDAEAAFSHAYNVHSKQGRPFAARVQDGRYAIALPPSALKEARAIGHEQLSFLDALSLFADLYLYMDVTSRVQIETVHAVNREASLTQFYQLLAVESTKHLAPVFDPPKGHDSTELAVLESVTAASSAIATSLLLGPGCPADLLVEVTAGAIIYNVSMLQLRLLRAQSPRPVKPLVWYFSRTARRLRLVLAGLKARLIPEIKQRLAIAMSADNNLDSSSFSLLNALILTTLAKQAHPTTPAEHHRVADLLCQQSLLYHFELARPTGTIVTHMLYQAMRSPEQADMLHAEVKAALKHCEDAGDTIHRHLLQHTPKLESFTREIFRMYDVSVFAGFRLTLTPQGITLTSLSPPLHLPQGTMIMTPSRAAHYDAAHYANPDTFDPLRFYDTATNTCAPRITTTSPAFLAFSHGKGSCPGRFMATAITRMLFARLLMAYRFEFVGGNTGETLVMDGAAAFPDPRVRMRVWVREGKGEA
ncbi:cytochrome P450 [Aspergillus mulundensis]|uniref:Cytochrome P450 n=1 Tax=Aspergillus mulundensis TaxID=1810919 RepID=A0A3D8QW51_9EURO|nr:hypothetical protein DSM5745_09660 [Aspergillus mulundensis]RDW65921.1 hypothetical protein DSM5745_09660 [Aspergillus mulundensis]